MEVRHSRTDTDKTQVNEEQATHAKEQKEEEEVEEEEEEGNEDYEDNANGDGEITQPPIVEPLFHGVTMPPAFRTEDTRDEFYATELSYRVINQRFEEGKRKSPASSAPNGGYATSGGSSQGRGGLNSSADVIVGGSEYYLNLLSKSFLPWMTDYHPWMAGYCSNSFHVALFDCSPLSNVTIPKPLRHDRCQHFIDLFFQRRYFGRVDNKASHSPEQFVESWNDFVEAMIQGPDATVTLIRSSKQRYYDNTYEGNKMKVHEMAKAERLPCGVPRGVDCPMCYKGDRRIPAGERRNPDGIIPTSLINAIVELDTKHQRELRRKKDEDVHRIIASRDCTSEINFSIQDFLRVSSHSISALQEAEYNKERMISLGAKIEAMENNGDVVHNAIEGLKDDVAFLRGCANGLARQKQKRKRTRTKKE